MKIRYKNFFYFSLYVLVLILAILGVFFLPDRFSGDVSVIIGGKFNSVIDFFSGFGITIAFYKYTGLKFLPLSVIAILQISIIFYVLKKIGIPKNFSKLTFENIIMYLGFALIGIFIAMPTKDFLTFLFFAYLVHYIVNSKKTGFLLYIVPIICIVIYALVFRIYFILVLALCMALYMSFLLYKVNTKWSFLLKGIFVVSLMSLVVHFVVGENLIDYAREGVNKYRGTKDSNSVIDSPFSNSNYIGALGNIIYGFISVNLPVNAFKHFTSPHIILFVFWQIFLFMQLYNKIKIEFTNISLNNKVLVMALFMFSYFVLQSVFEPDLGSAVRHKIGLFPLIYITMYYHELFYEKKS